jgi:hypothetical protein
MAVAEDLRAKRSAMLPLRTKDVPALVRAVHKAPAKPPLGEVGATGTPVDRSPSGGQIHLLESDYNPDLKGVAFFKEIERMRKSDSQVKAVMSMLKLPLRASDWKFESASDKPEDREIADWISDRFFNRQMRTWDYILYHILLSLDYGCMPFETVFKVEDDDRLDRPMIHLEKLAPRMPETIVEWILTDAGDLDHIMQQTSSDLNPKKIEGDRLLPFVHEMEGSNYRGSSILRNARKDWLIKERLQRINQVAIEKRASGIDVGKMDENAITDARNKGAFEGVLQTVRTHERGYVLLPPGHEYSIAGIEGQVLDPLPSIKYADILILRGILADFLTAGTGGEGSHALVADRSSFFLMALNGISKEILDPINRWLIPRWVRWNWPDVSDFPVLQHSRLDRRDVSAMTTALKELIPMGVLTPDDNIEKELRDILDLPQLEQSAMPELLPVPGGEVPALVDPDTGPEAFKRLKNRVRTPYQVRSNKMRPVRTAAERAVDWITMSNALDKTEDAIVKAYRSIQNRQIEKLVDEAMKAIGKGDADLLEAVNVPFKNDAADLILKPLVELYRLGQNEVKHEMSRMGGDPIRLGSPMDIDDDKAVLAFLRARSRMVATVLSDRLRATTLRTGMDMIKHGSTDRLLLKGALTELSDRAIKAEAGRSISEALNLGRESTAKKNAMLVRRAEYSAIMDKVTCDECESLEGKTFIYGSADFEEAKPPYQNCEGRGRCRCVMIYTFASESKGR